MNKIDVACQIAEQLDARVKRQTVPVRAAFIASSDPTMPPPMTFMLRGGRGGEVKLKLLLSMLWVAVGEPYDVSQPARVWAELIGLDDPEGKGAARVNAAARRLVEGRFLGAEKRPGRPSRLFLREETGSGAPYTHPGSHWETKNPKLLKTAPRYTRLPSDLWVKGWMAQLSAPALAMLVVLLEQSRGKNFEELWFSPSVAAKRYGLSETTRRRGIDELAESKVIFVDHMPVGRGGLSMIRQRKTFTINMARLSERPDVTSPAKPIVNASGRTIRSKQDAKRMIAELFADVQGPASKTSQSSDEQAAAVGTA